MQDKGQAQVCPFCGYREGTPAAAPHYLKPGTVLAGKYLVGKGLGHGGFGTTYIARDQVLGIKLAIKEYLPQDCASRQPGTNLVVPYTGEGGKRFTDGLESFLQEARTLARFDGAPNIVGVRDFFTENGTAYLVMNYLEGITLKQYLVRSGGKPVPFDKMLGILLPVMDALRTVHAAGLLHRDISPDNIFLTTSGQVTLIDFGAARQSMNVQQSMSVILKPGYAPEEQYRSRGHQGPWTDIYALGATMYRTLTGRIPPESLERQKEDCLVPPSRLGIRIPAYAEAAILRAMAVRAEDRFQTIDEFRAALLRNNGEAPATPANRANASEQNRASAQRVEARHPRQEDPVTYPLDHRNSNKKKKGLRPAVVIVAILMLLILGIVALFFYYLTSIMGRGEGLNIGSITLNTPPAATQPAATPTATPAPATDAPAQETESAEPTPTPEATPDPALAPFIEGTAPTEAIQDFAPMHGRMMMVEEEGQKTLWVTGRAPSVRPDMLCGRFAYNVETNEAVGDVYGFYLSDAGDLRYTSIEEPSADVLVLPAECTVGTTFHGMLGSCKVYAVNYSGASNGMELRNCIVLQCDDGYAFFQSGRGLVLLQTQFDGGQMLYRMLTDEADTEGIYRSFVE